MFPVWFTVVPILVPDKNIQLVEKKPKLLLCVFRIRV